MARKLKTFTTSLGFFDLAVAAPSMKAALEAWNSGQNLFHQGLARETGDPDIVAATMEKPGVVLRRAVGTNRPYQEHAALPDTLPARRQAPTPKRSSPAKSRPRPDAVSQKAAVISFEQARARRESLRRQEEVARAKEEAARKRKDERRQQAMSKAAAVLEQARKHHAERIRQLERERQTVEGKLAAEKERWRLEEERLERNVREAGT